MADLITFGWIKLHRTFYTHPVWCKPSAARVFLWMLGAAAPFERTDRSFRPFVVDRGQLVTSYREIAEHAKVTKREVEGAVAHLRKEGI